MRKGYNPEHADKACSDTIWTVCQDGVICRRENKNREGEVETFSFPINTESFFGVLVITQSIRMFLNPDFS